MRRETQNVLLVLLGGALAKIAVDGTFLRYVKPSLQPWLLATGVLIVALAVVAIVRDLRAGGSGENHEHEHAARSPWMLVLPVLAIFLIAPPALGASSVDTTSTRSVAQSSATVNQQFPPLPTGDAPPLLMVDFVQRAVFDADGSLDGREVTLTGFTVADAAGRTDLARLTIGCCAADALPVRVALDGGDREAELDALPSDAWLVVRGTLQPGTATPDNNYVPTLTVTGLERTAAPEDPYEY